MMITSQGMIVRTPVATISCIGRSTQGVRLIGLDENDRLVSYVPNLPISEAFNLADAITGKAITGIADTIMLPSLMNIDFADVRSVMENGGFALISAAHLPSRP